MVDVGDWVTLPNGRTGQVWAVAGCRISAEQSATCRHRRCPPAVWVADGERWHLLELAGLGRHVVRRKLRT